MVLEGIRVIDFSQYIPGSYASLRLAEMGAEVIKIEPLNGSPMRNFGKDKHAEGIVFSATNDNKKSVAMNLKTEEGKNLAKELIKQSDILIESYRPGVMERFGLHYDEIKKQKRDIIYCSLSGYGQKGTLFGSHDLNYQSVSGLMSQFKDKNGKPVLPKITFADIMGGLTASEKIVAALLQRERTGEGQYIDIALIDTVLSLMNINLYTKSQTGFDNVNTALEGEIVSYNIYETKDNRYVSLAALELKFWENFCKAVGHEEWIPIHLSITSEDNIPYQELKGLFKSKNLNEWMQFSLEVDACLSPVLEVGEVKEHPYLVKKKYLHEKKIAPSIGQHTDEVLKNILFKSELEINELKKIGVLY